MCAAVCDAIADSMEWAITIIAIIAFGSLSAFAGWKSGRPPKDSLNVQWISWPLVTVLAGPAAIFGIIHVITLLGFQTGANTLGRYGL